MTEAQALAAAQRTVAKRGGYGDPELDAAAARMIADELLAQAARDPFAGLR